MRGLFLAGTQVETGVKHNSGLFWEVKTPSSFSGRLGIHTETANWEISIKDGPWLESLAEDFVKS